MTFLARLLALLKGLLLFPWLLFSQQYTAIRYDISNGLPTELLKSVISDRYGFIWVASDAGVARFNGTEFFSYSDALPSQYAKGFCKTKDHRLFVASDMGITEIVSEPDTVYFRKFLEGRIFPEPEKVNYPKAIYEDSHAYLWISEPTSLLRVSANQRKRYFFPPDYSSSSFFRSFCVLEDSTQRLWVTSYGGFFFMYDASKDAFVSISIPEKISNIACLYPMGQRSMLVGCKEGVYEVEIDEQLRCTVFRKISSLLNVSHINQVKANTFFVGSFSENLGILIRTDWGWEEDSLPGVQRIKHVFVSEEGEAWLATDIGLYFVQENFFQKITYETSHAYYHYTETVKGEGKSVYAIIKSSIFKIREKQGRFYAKEIHYDESAYFLSLSCRKDGKFWVSSRDKLFYFENDKFVKQYDFSHNNQQYIFYIYEDHRENIWFRQEGMSGLFQITKNGLTKRYDARRGFPVKSEVIRGSFKSGELYAGGSDSLHYLFRYDVKADSFINISVPLPFSVKSSFSIKDLCVDDQERIWLASTEGLLCYDNGTIRRIFLGKDHTTLPSRAVEVSNYGKIWFANTHGLIMYDPKNEQYAFFDDSHGLPSKTISRNGIFIKPPHQQWIATSRGLAYRDEPMHDFPKTKKPIVTNLMVNGKPQPIKDSLFVVPHDAYVVIQYVSLSFPGNEIEYQTKVEGLTADWTSTTKKEIVFPRLSH
ncbi:MAG: hypothetical protein NZ521_05405, partial [Flammeovirgaceae bacterium]|nr:hypothetical protein [Flammeovirgaceae bacterium]MDW8287667.1 hypothetical protein [Flammeovirgaceae bacterium]